MDPTTEQPETQGKLAQLMALFSGGKPAPEAPTVPINGTKDTSADSGAKDQVVPSPTGGDGLLGALKNLVQFFQAKAGSASNDSKYKKAMDDAGVPEDETGLAQ